MRWSRLPGTTARPGRLALMVLLVACGGGGVGGTTATAVSSETTSSAVASSTVATMGAVDDSQPEIGPVAEAAVADLVSRLDVDPSGIDVLVAERVTWPDGRLGCPEPVRPYTLEQVQGFRVVLGHEGRTYHYHAGSDAVPYLCGSMSRRAGGPGTPAPSIPPPIK